MANQNAHRRDCREIPQPVWDKALGGLTDREAQVIRLRFGLGGKARQTVGQVAKSLGLTRERVRRIETKVLNRLRKAPPGNGP